MGGFGSGKKSGRKPKKTTERVPSIDIRHLHKQGYLKSVFDGIFTWSIAGTEYCSVSFTMYVNKMVLHYSQRSVDGEWVQSQQEIFFDQTRCNFGGRRKWFLCDKCGRRVAILYYIPGGFLCRHCHNLTYESQQEDKEYRMMRKARKIRKQLGASDDLFYPILEKPKNMHYSTFERLCKEAEDAHYLSWSVMEDRFAKHH